MFKKKDGTAAIGRIIAAVIALIAIAAVALSSFVVIPAGNTGVLVTLGKVDDIVMQEGMHAKIPFMQQVVLINNRITKLEVSTQAFSKDLQTVTAVLAVNYRISKDMSNSIYKNVGSEYQRVLVEPAVHEVLKAVVAQYTASTLVSDRSAVSIRLDEQIKEKLAPGGILVEDLNIIDWDFSDEYIQAIEQKQVAEQNLMRAETEKQQALVKAQGEAEAQIIESEARAKRILIEAEATAKYNDLIKASINQELINYETINKWNGQLPKVQSGGTPLIGIDLEALESAE